MFARRGQNLLLQSGSMVYRIYLPRGNQYSLSLLLYYVFVQSPLYMLCCIIMIEAIEGNFCKNEK